MIFCFFLRPHDTLFFLLSRISLFFLCPCLCISSCSNNSTKRMYERMISQTISLPETLIPVSDGFILSDNNPNVEKFRLIVYIDSEECSSCRITDFSRYIAFFEEFVDSKDCVLLPIISISETDVGSVSYRIKHLHFPFCFFLDINNSFLELNPFIPTDRRFHSFLIDPSGHVVFIGDPTLNDNLQKLFHKSFNNLN